MSVRSPLCSTAALAGAQSIAQANVASSNGQWRMGVRIM